MAMAMVYVALATLVCSLWMCVCEIDSDNDGLPAYE